MPAPSVFGEIAGYKPGEALFPDRKGVRQAGLHRHDQAGISGNCDDGADAIVVSGGYRDDRDYGNRLIYTGQGGRDTSGKQVADQTLTRGNRGLVRSEHKGLPVRVIRGSGGDSRFSPKSGYRYDGLFRVVRHWVETSIDGPLIYRFELEKADDQGTWPVWHSNSKLPLMPEGRKDAGRVATVIQRLVRNSAVADYVKQLYNYACQFCGVTLQVAAGAYAEGAHIRPLGGVHAGADEVANLLCLCPNDHVLFDKGALYLTDSLDIVGTASKSKSKRLNLRHNLDMRAVAYHREHIAGII